ncbi:MAG: PAS domain S-box protein [Magnetococcus sp. YQC-5]
MRKPDLLPNESERLQVLHALKILDTPPEERFDRLTRIAQYTLKVPIVLISLIDENRQWFKSRQGLDAIETHRDISFCGHAIHGSEILCVPDALQDFRFADNPLVCQAPNIRFYAGAPLEVTPGQRVGTLCVIDSKPRELTAEQAAILTDLAGCVVAELRAVEVFKLAQQLRDLEAHWRTLLDTLVLGVVTIDARGTIKTVNPATERMLGYPASELLGQNVRMLMPEPWRSGHDGYLKHYLTSGQAKVIGLGREVVGQCRDGSTFPMELAVGEMRVRDEPIFVGIISDITVRRRAELALESSLQREQEQSRQLAQKNTELADMNLIKNQFLGMAAHDLRNPLSALLGMSTLLLDAPQLQEADKRTFFASIKRVSEQMLDIVNDLLDVAIIESGCFVLNRQVESLKKLVMERVVLARFTAQTKGTVIEFAEKMSVLATFDAGRLGQVVDNLLSNAIKFSPAGSRVWVRLSEEVDHVGFSVADQGPGISEADMDRLFGQFQKLSNRSTAGEKSTGLGLAISHKIVAAHGGSLQVESVQGNGSRFIVTLPRS